MSYRIVQSNRFEKDLRQAKKRGKDLDKLFQIIGQLANGETLAEKHRDHSLTGNFAGFRECHIEPDWLLIYRIEQSELYLFLARTGTHSDLFE